MGCSAAEEETGVRDENIGGGVCGRLMMRPVIQVPLAAAAAAATASGRCRQQFDFHQRNIALSVL